MQSAGQAGSDILGGYLQGKQLHDAETTDKLKPYEIYTNIADKVGPDRANAIFKQIGMPVPQISGDSSGLGINTPPEQLLGQGAYGQKMLQGRNTIDEMKKRDLEAQNNMPYTPEVVRAVLKDNPHLAEGLISAHQGQPVPYREVQNAISTIRPNMMGNYFQGRLGTMQLTQLPSQMGTNTAAGAAYQVKIASRQGKSLISKATSPQSLALVNADLSRAVNRSAPLSETIAAGNYGQSLPTLWSAFQQKMTADPNGPDVPLIRKKLYDTFDELEKASTPWITNHLQNMEDNGTNSTFGNNWGSVKQRELGLNIPEIPFDSGVGSIQNPNIGTGVPQGKVRVSNGKQSFYIDPTDIPNARNDGFLPQ